MSALRSPGLGVGLTAVLALALFVGAIQGQDKEKRGKRAAQAGPTIVRQVYAVHGGSAKELASALLPHFRTDPTFQVLPATGNKTLILSGPKDLVEEANVLLREIDRPARTVRVEVFLVELTPKGAGTAELSGPMGKVVTKLVEMQNQGMIAHMQRVELSVLERDSARYQSVDSRPYVTGIGSGRGFGVGGDSPFGTGGAGGRAKGGAGAGGDNPPGSGRKSPAALAGVSTMSRTISYRNIGTQVQVNKPEIAADGQVELQIQVEDSQMRSPTGAPEVGADEKGAAVVAPDFINSTLDGRLRIPRGNIVVAQTTQANSRTSQGQTLILVGVRAD